MAMDDLFASLNDGKIWKVATRYEKLPCECISHFASRDDFPGLQPMSHKKFGILLGINPRPLWNHSSPHPNPEADELAASEDLAGLPIYLQLLEEESSKFIE
jgi:hypothetical protein